MNVDPTDLPQVEEINPADWAMEPIEENKHRADFYKVKVNFIRRFVKGTLEGLDHKDSIRFVSNVRAMGWIKGIQSNFNDGKLDYFIESFEIVANN